jgi:hypothetical protein
MRPVALVEIDVDFGLALIGGLEGGLDIGLEGRLIAFDGEQIVCSGVADGLGDPRIAGDGVDGDDGAFEAAAGGEFLEQQRNGGRFVGLVVGRLLSEDQTAVGGEGLKPDAAPLVPWPGRGCGARSCRRWRSCREARASRCEPGP